MESDLLNMVLLQRTVICKELCSVSIFICSCFSALHFTVWHNQHHRNRSALQRALESSIYARIRAFLPFTGSSGQRNSCLGNSSRIAMKKDKCSHEAAFL